jgi:hypothetical protein
MLTVVPDDIRVLESKGLIRVTHRGKGAGMVFRVTVEGEDHYAELKRRAGEPVAQVEDDLRTYLDAEQFRSRYGKAHERWSRAAELVWRADSLDALTTIGHLTREAMQDFATALVERHQPSGVNTDPTKTLDRVSAVIQQHRPQLGESRSDFLDALFGYWRAANGLVQRQEHGGQKENEPLVWEDGRRVIFHTAVVMAELDRAF